MFDIYRDKKIFITGDTGFKGSWLSVFFRHLQVKTSGYALEPATEPNHFNLTGGGTTTTFGNILDREKLNAAIEDAQPDIIFHLAAQALVRPSYTDPVNTYETNVTGTLNVLEAARRTPSVKAMVLITTDKVYENKEVNTAYTEEDELGGYDMYSSSKACCEILIRSYRNSFLNIEEYGTKHHTLIASARAGNVIGGGDWSADRLLPDIAVAASKKTIVKIRNPLSVRPWQHVLDCLHGYLLLGEKLLQGDVAFSGAWNFSPYSSEAKNVESIAAIAKNAWNDVDIAFGKPDTEYHEAGLLILDNSKAVAKLGWKPVWNTETAVSKTIDWYKNYFETGTVITEQQIAGYIKSINS